MSLKILHLLSQRPSLTGSGVTLDALVRHAAMAGWKQRVVVGVPAGEQHPEVGGIGAEQVHPLEFGTGELDFAVPGMSDVMPYTSSRFAALSSAQLQAYRQAWRQHLQRLAREFAPDIVHAHHVWILSSLVKDVFPCTPVVTQCHATGLRQMELCPHLAGAVRAGCRRNERFLVLQTEHARQLASTLQLATDRIAVIGTGFRQEIFHARGRDRQARNSVLYVGKYSAAKGLPWLLDAVASLTARRRDIVLHVAGSGTGEEADALRKRMEEMAPHVRLHGQLSQQELAGLMRRCAVCVLPSFFEGVPLVLVEALACGCRLIATRLPGVVEQLAPAIGPALELVPLPRLTKVDTPVVADLPLFVSRLEGALDRNLDLPLLGDPRRSLPEALQPFGWATVFGRVERIWRDVCAA